MVYHNQYRVQIGKV